MTKVGRRWASGAVLGFALFEFVLTFVPLLVTYRLLESAGPDMLGAVAAEPARFAAWIALVKTPLAIGYLLIYGRRGWRALAAETELPDPPPARRGWRRVLSTVGHLILDVVWTAVAALVVFHYLADPGDARVWPLVAVSAVGPPLVTGFVSVLLRPLRRWWRRRRDPSGRRGPSTADASRPAPPPRRTA